MYSVYIISLFMCLHYCDSCTIRCYECYEKHVNFPFLEPDYHEGEHCLQAKNELNNPTSSKFCYDYKNVGCMTTINIVIPNVNYMIANNAKEIYATEMNILRTCIRSFDHNVSINKDKDNHQIRINKFCSDNNCNGISVLELLSNEVANIIPVCLECRGLMSDKECVSYNKDKTNVARSLNSFCNGVCYSVVEFSLSKPYRITRGCMTNDQINNQRDINKAVVAKARFVYPNQKNVNVIEYCLPLAGLPLCNVNEHAKAIDKNIIAEHTQSEYHYCLYCESTNDNLNVDCLKGQMTSPIFGRIVCRGPCYSLQLEWKLLRGCIDHMYSIGGLIRDEYSTLVTYSTNKLVNGCFSKNGEQVCQQICDGNRTHYCNDINNINLERIGRQNSSSSFSLKEVSQMIEDRYKLNKEKKKLVFNKKSSIVETSSSKYSNTALVGFSSLYLFGLVGLFLVRSRGNKNKGISSINYAGKENQYVYARR